MKLNNHGWGYRDMIIASSVIIILLFVVAVQVDALYDGIQATEEKRQAKREEINNKLEQSEKEEDRVIVGEDDEPESNTTIVVDYDYYRDRENELKQAASAYMTAYNYDLSGEIMTITLDTLINLGYMREVYDQTGSSVCDGFVNVYEDSNTGEYVITPSITCNNYKTK